MCTMSNLNKRWHGNDLSFVQCTNHHWRDLMPLSALSRIKHIDYIITSLYGELNIITIAGVDWPFIRITDCQQLPIEMIQ